MNEFTQLLELVQDLTNKVAAQQLQINNLREQVAELTEQQYGHAEPPPAEDQAQ
ncbi:hypothetical protein [Microbulbifer sp. SAOS-129_SWC]|uniref:hypothetical protein n=1 Tax=Microbulbifer sp. SAOS-129_SWC TaxID=3145235 RepID=UPI00321778D8